MTALARATGRGRQAVTVLRTQGARAVLRRSVRWLSVSVGADLPELDLHPEDVADSSSIVTLPHVRPSGDRLTVAWVMTPPSRGSGGHTTAFRFVEALERAGHTCVLYLYDRFDGDLARHTEAVRSWWPQIAAEVRDIGDGLGRHDAYVATGWPTAHVLASRGTEPGERFYLVQDFEPYFFPRGSEYALVEDTYRFGFHCLTVGYMVADELRDRIGIDATVAEFGCDTDVYSVTNPSPRRDVVFYTKPGTARRGYELGVLALERFHQRHPEVVIHTFGSTSANLRFPAEVHGRMQPADLNRLYNDCAAGLALSFTNISLIANELLAAGTVPIVNDSPLTRADLDNPFVRWASPTPQGLADALSDVVERHVDGARVVEIGASVADLSWIPAQQRVVEAIERRCFEGPADRA